MGEGAVSPLDGLDAVTVYFVQRSCPFRVQVNEETRPVLARTLFITTANEYVIDEREDARAYAVLEANILLFDHARAGP